MTSECKGNKKFDMDDVANLPIEEAWVDVVETANNAARSRDLDDFRTVRHPISARRDGTSPC